MAGLSTVGSALAPLIYLLYLGYILMYAYAGAVLFTLAKKLKHKDIAWLAWVPGVQLFLLPILAKQKWLWGFVYLIYLLPYLLVVLSPNIGVLLSAALMLDHFVIYGLIICVPMGFTIFWSWKIFKQRNYPGWLSLILAYSLFPLFLIGIINYVEYYSPAMMLFLLGLTYFSQLIYLGYAVTWGLVAWKDRK